MPLNMNLWNVSENGLTEIKKAKLDQEAKLEDWIARDTSLLGTDLLLIGRQVSTEFGGRIDLLGIDQEGNMVVLELKRDKTPREVVAQILDYASWVRKLTYPEIESIASEYVGRDLTAAFNGHFGVSLPETVNKNHKMLVIASEFDESSERIVAYLADEYKVNINAIFFSFFEHAGQEIMGRAWLMDPEVVEERAETRKQRPWSGYWFVNVGEGEHRNWEDNAAYGYIAAGQAEKFSRPLKKLKVGDKVFAYMKGHGYTGYGEVESEAVMVKDFFVKGRDKYLLELPLKAPLASENSENPELSDWAVGVRWIKTVPRGQAQRFTGIFANQNIVCKLRDEATVSFLEETLTEQSES
jgi:hypothetical protein